MSSDLDERLAKAIEVRDQLKADIQRIEGRREAALKSLSEVEEEIRKRNLDPSTLDDTVSKFESEVQIAQKALSPYLEIK